MRGFWETAHAQFMFYELVATTMTRLTHTHPLSKSTTRQALPNHPHACKKNHNHHHTTPTQGNTQKSNWKLSGSPHQASTEQETPAPTQNTHPTLAHRGTQLHLTPSGNTPTAQGTMYSNTHTYHRNGRRTHSHLRPSPAASKASGVMPRHSWQPRLGPMSTTRD